jgi:hypothetical protein
VGGNLLHAWLARAQAGVVDAGRWRYVAARRCRTVFLMPYHGRFFDEVEIARAVPPNLRPLTVA